jgi:hypothetical protein
MRWLSLIGGNANRGIAGRLEEWTSGSIQGRDIDARTPPRSERDGFREIDDWKYWLGRQDSNLRMPVPKFGIPIFPINRKPQNSADSSTIKSDEIGSRADRDTS